MSDFLHLHTHTQYSLLDGAASISSLYKKAAADGMKGIAITDHGNMFGVFEFVAEAAKHKTADGQPLKPIVGCEFYLVENRHKNKFGGGEKDRRCHQLLLAKNSTGYKNLVKLCSLGYIEGIYGKYPRIDKELILQYHEGLIATTCCLGAEVPQTILSKGEAAGEEAFKWWLDLFGEDYYVELQRHGMEEQEKVNQVLIRFARKYQVPIIASNDSHYVDQKDFNAHDILLCINTGEKQATPALRDFADDDVQVKGKRFAFFNDQFYFKTTAEMQALFQDVPEATVNTAMIYDKVDHLKLKQDILLPHYQLPPDFTDQDDYLKHLTWLGAQQRYSVMTADIEERINFELHTIRTMGFAGYFLIVQDFINHGKDIGVFVGPGRGSAAGSVVAYCIGITNIDPIKYNLLFERFLNPDRKSMPDIDTDFDDEGRDKVIRYVVEKYGKAQVAQIITYGTMAAKSSIKDVARVMDLPLPESNMLANLVPGRPGTSLKRCLYAPLEGAGSLKEKENFGAEELENIKKLREIMSGESLQATVLKEATTLEGSVRNTGIHAAGIIIAPKDLTEILPVATAKDSDLWVTQFEGNVIEDAGVIKMDFLGLKTLTIIRDALRLIEENHGVKIDIDTIPLDDAKTYELYQRGDTNGTFQFESVGMQKYLRELKPDKFEDLIAMNALYRPGPIEYIPNFIKRKHGKEAIAYDLPEMEEYLHDTYGITVYQEQVMLLSQKLGGFTKGDADTLRKAMGKKQIEVLNKMKSKFMEGATAKGFEPKILEKIWTDWEAFAQYAFNKSHSTCYAFVAYQTAYLKAHYTSEYMAAVLSNNLGNLDKLTFFMEESRRLGIPVLGPDINESNVRFAVNKKGEIRFALSAIKGVGEGAVESIIEERQQGGPFKSIFDLTRRANLRMLNKKAMENLALGGAFDSFGKYSRNTYITPDLQDGTNLIDKAIRYGNSEQSNKAMNQSSLFGGAGHSESVEPKVENREEWPFLEKLKLEKEVVGIYISGHPLDSYRLEIQTFTSCPLSQLVEFKDKDIRVAGIVTSAQHKIAKNGNPFGSFMLEDYEGNFEFVLFGKQYIEFKNYMEAGRLLYISGRYQQRFNQPDNYEFRITKIDLLPDVRAQYTKRVTLTLQAASITDSFTEALHEVLKKYPGKLPVNMKLVDEEEKISVTGPARKISVDASNEFLSALKELETVQVSLN
ncbi:MAG: DNA polymerase III subunit alpha [Chitinophagales bacterium]